jgi:hypothetical protein
MMLMKFNQRQWINEIASGTIAGLLGAVIVVTIAPDVPHDLAVATGGIVGFATSVVNLPLKWLLDRRPGAKDRED